MAIDPVCGKEVPEAAVDAPETNPVAGTKRYHEGKWYYLCSIACRLKFMAAPDEYIQAAAEN